MKCQGESLFKTCSNCLTRFHSLQYDSRCKNYNPRKLKGMKECLNQTGDIVATWTGFHAALSRSAYVTLDQIRNDAKLLETSIGTHHKTHNKLADCTSHTQSQSPGPNEHDWRKLYSHQRQRNHSRSTRSFQTGFYIRNMRGSVVLAWSRFCTTSRWRDREAVYSYMGSRRGERGWGLCRQLSGLRWA